MKAEYIQHMGTDLVVANAARVSFNSHSSTLEKRDIRLIQYLARGCSDSDWAARVRAIVEWEDWTYSDAQAFLFANKNQATHWTPFSHVTITMRETVPVFVARQRFKHVVGFTYNEISRRYVDDSPTFFTPDVWRSRPDASIKQGSGDPHHAQLVWKNDYQEYITKAEELYNSMIKNGVAPEQARMVLPQSMFTSYYVTGSLAAWARAYIQRSHTHAQVEIQKLAKQWDIIIEPLFPHSWKALTRS